MKQQELEQDEKNLSDIREEQEKYSNGLRMVSEIIHPFSTKDSKPQTSTQVESLLEKQAQEFENIANNSDINDSKARLKKFIKQIKDMACFVNSWWLWAIESIVGYGLGKEKQDWLLYTLLPVIYWHQLSCKAQNTSNYSAPPS